MNTNQVPHIANTNGRELHTSGNATAGQIPAHSTHTGSTFTDTQYATVTSGLPQWHNNSAQYSTEQTHMLPTASYYSADNTMNDYSFGNTAHTYSISWYTNQTPEASTYNTPNTNQYHSIVDNTGYNTGTTSSDMMAQSSDYVSQVNYQRYRSYQDSF